MVKMGRQAALKILFSKEVELAVWEWEGAEPALLFVHATGFHGRCWDQIIRMFPERRCLAVEARGHGRSSKPEPPYYWRALGRDLVFVAEKLALRGTIGIGHSMGGHTIVQAAAVRPDAFAALLLVDPTIFPRAYYGGPPPDASFTLRRRSQWRSADEMYERFHERMPFMRWRPQILRDYCDYGVLPDGEGFVLACPPRVEASIYETCREPAADIYPEIAMVRQPVTVVRAKRTRDPGVFDLSLSPTSPELASCFANGREVVVEEGTHYIAMEEPELVVKEIRKLSGGSLRIAR